jgi:hypothetical protein
MDNLRKSLFYIVMLIALFSAINYRFDIIRITFPVELKILDVIYALGSAGTVSTAVTSFYHWVWLPHKKRKAEMVNTVYIPISQMLYSISADVKVYKALDAGELHKKIIDTSLPRELREELKVIENHIKNYHEWLSESGDIIRHHVKSKVNDYQELRRDWEILGIGYLHNVLISHVKIPIYERELSPELVKEHLFNDHGRDYQKKSEDKTVKLKDLLETDQMYKIIRSLKTMENRPSIGMLRKSRNSLLDKLNELSKRIQNKMQET